MKKETNKLQPDLEDEMLPEYDLRGKTFERGKYYEAYRKGALVRIHHKDGSVTVRPIQAASRAIILDPDVRKYFPDSESVNRTLRSPLALVAKPTRRKKTKSARARAMSNKKLTA